ncbi:MAG: hypothetical protein N2Z21_09230 [Candidatus Sumerlaeaceae bacterium]|nr:hypothetical protein [Candidatus Sumerlaeaceae bacterium]
MARWRGVCLVLVVLGFAGGAAGGTRLMTDDLPSTHPAKQYKFTKAEDGSEWAVTPWGRLGVAELKTAPFPDDSRTSGFVTKRGVIPYEGHYDDSRVAFAVPEPLARATQSSAGVAKLPLPEIDLIVHFHGHGNECLNAMEQFRLGEQLAASTKQAVLVIPQGPKYAADSGGGKLEKDGAFAAFVREVLEVLKRNNMGATQETELRFIIVSGHSGAYRVIAKILDHGGEWDRIREVWLFDAAYGFFDELALPATAPSRYPKRLRSIFTDHLAPENAEIMGRIFLAGRKPAIVSDDTLTTRGTWLTELQRRKGVDDWAQPETDALDAILEKEPVLFIYTHMGHNELIYERRYFERFARQSPNLSRMFLPAAPREKTPEQ